MGGDGCRLSVHPASCRFVLFITWTMVRQGPPNPANHAPSGSCGSGRPMSASCCATSCCSRASSPATAARCRSSPSLAAAIWDERQWWGNVREDGASCKACVLQSASTSTHKQTCHRALQPAAAHLRHHIRDGALGALVGGLQLAQLRDAGLHLRLKVLQQLALVAVRPTIQQLCHNGRGRAVVLHPCLNDVARARWR